MEPRADKIRKKSIVILGNNLFTWGHGFLYNFWMKFFMRTIVLKSMTWPLDDWFDTIEWIVILYILQSPCTNLNTILRISLLRFEAYFSLGMGSKFGPKKGLENQCYVVPFFFIFWCFLWLTLSLKKNNVV